MLTALDAVCKRHAIPTQHCVLSHVTVQMKALALGCPMDLMFLLVFWVTVLLNCGGLIWLLSTTGGRVLRSTLGIA